MTLYDFWRVGCAPCTAIKPMVQRVCDQLGVELTMVNVDDRSDIAAAHRVRSVPTLVLTNDEGHFLDRHVGAMSEAELTALIETNR